MKNSPVTLRRRATKAGRISLYLDIYRHGQRRYEYLKLYLVPEKSREDKLRNRDTLRLAEAIAAKRAVELLNNEYGFTTNHEEVDFVTLFAQIAVDKARTTSPSTAATWAHVLRHLQIYTRGKRVPLRSVTARWIDDFNAYLATARVSKNTRWLYHTKIRSAIVKALRDGLIRRDPMVDATPVRKEEHERTFLTLDELRAITDAPCADEAVKRAFLFSCLTGLRKSDVLALRWGDVREEADGYAIAFRQQKTGGMERLAISEQAFRLLGHRGGDDNHPLAFRTAVLHYVLPRWMASAGITRHVTFHCARHTFATLMLTLGTDIYTLSKLLGHRNITTTQVYARVVDKKKREAVSLIPDIGATDSDGSDR